jgi:2-isopropylmalate synthase/UPF0716 protein FxsA
MIYFLIYLFFEVIISVNISSAIGGLNTFFEIMLSAFVGISILINFRSTLSENMSAFSMHHIDLEEFQRLNIFTLVGAFLLIVPGFLTDILGLLLQFSVFTKMLVNRFTAKSHMDRPTHHQTTIEKEDNVIDVEIIHDDTVRH